MKRLWVVLCLVLVATLALPLSAAAAGSHDVLLDGRIVFGGSFTLAAGETLDGDLLVFGGSATLEESSTVTGSVFLMGGNLNSAGTIFGDLALMGGNANLQAGAVVQGDVSTFGGNVNRDPGARIEGQVITGGDTIEIPGLQGVPQWQFPFVERTWPARPMIDFNPSPLWDGGWLLLQSLILAALAVLVVRLLGLLGIPALLIGMAITICLIPFMLVGVMVFVAAIVYGWMAIGLEVGERLTRAFKWHLDPAAAAGLGTFVVSLVANGVNFIPCIGWLAPTLVGALGLGAVLLTRFGRQAYPGRAAVVEVPPAA